MIVGFSPYCQITEGCQNFREGNKPGCASCNAALRKMARYLFKPKKKQKAIPKRSEKKKKEDIVYSKLRKEHLNEHPNCQIKIMGICEGRAIEVHHPGKRGNNYLKKELFMSACRPCHNHVEFVMSAKERREKGLLKD